MRFIFDERDPAALRTLMQWKSAQYRRTGRMDRFSRPWIVDLVDYLSRVREEHFTGCCPCCMPVTCPWRALRAAIEHGAATWFTGVRPELRYYSPGLMMHLRLAEAAARHGVTLVDMGRGDKEYKDWLNDPGTAGR